MRAIKKPTIVFVFSEEGSPSSTRYGGFANRLSRYGGLEDFNLVTVALQNIVYTIKEDGTAEVVDSATGIRFQDVDFVYFKSWSRFEDEAYALAHYLSSLGIPFIDSRVLGRGKSKLITIMLLWKHSLPVPMTIYSRSHKHFAEYLLTNRPLTEPFILKDVYGSKGSDNYLVTYAQADKILKTYPNVAFMAQRFIPNSGDYRIGVYGGQAKFFLHRLAAKGSHLNNIIAGGTGKKLEVGAIPEGLGEMAEKAAAVVNLEVAGVDVIIDTSSNQPYILEINLSSQIVTGAFKSEKIALFNQALVDMVGLRLHREPQGILTIIGRRTPVSLPDLGVTHLIAKVDTGAYSLTLHAENIAISKNKKGESELTFNLTPRDGFVTKSGKMITIRTKDFTRRRVTSTSGKVELRYCIWTTLRVGGKTIYERLTLTDRSSMRYPLLIGRRLLRSHFLVNIELDEGKYNTRRTTRKPERTKP